MVERDREEYRRDEEKERKETERGAEGGEERERRESRRGEMRRREGGGGEKRGRVRKTTNWIKSPSSNILDSKNQNSDQIRVSNFKLPSLNI